MTAYTTASERETEDLAAELAGLLRPGDIVAFRGGLGVGKTAFVRGLAAGLGIKADVTSPTFSLVHEYRGERAVLYHFDMYRVSGWDALESTGFFDYLDSGGVLAVEWSEHIRSALPPETITVEMQIVDENTRAVTVEGGDRF